MFFTCLLFSGRVVFGIFAFGPITSDLGQTFSKQSDADVLAIIDDMTEFDFSYLGFKSELDLLTNEP